MTGDTEALLSLQARLMKLIVQEIDDPSCQISCSYSALHYDLITRTINDHLSLHRNTEVIW